MRKLTSFFLVVTLWGSALAIQKKGRDTRSDAAQRQAEEIERKTQALDILKGVVEGAAEIKEMPARVAVVTEALDLLWKHDETYARANFIKFAEILSDQFVSDTTDVVERSQLRSTLGTLLKTFARHDPEAANRLLDKFQKLLDELLKGGSVSPSERLALAQAGLESDLARSVALAAKVLEVQVPRSFPAYLNELEQRDSATAASLFRTALSLTASTRIYSPVEVTVLSTYVFREPVMSIPVASGSDEFGMFASPLSPPSKELNRSLASAYVAAASSYLNAEIIVLEQSREPDAIRAGLSFFLVKKLRGYAERLNLASGPEWLVLDTKYTLLAERAGLSAATLSGIETVARRIVTENTVFHFDGGDSAFAAADKATDAAKRAELTATGVQQMIDEGKYADALQKIDDLENGELRAQLNDYRSLRMAEAAIKRLDWNSLNAQANRLSDARLRTYLALLAALAASDAGEREMTSEFLLAAMAAAPKIEDADDRAAALVSMAGILSGGKDASWAAQILNEAVEVINRAGNYDGSEYSVRIRPAKYTLLLVLPRSSLNHSFEQAAKRDWAGSIAAAQGIKSRTLRSRAYIAVCRNVLRASR